MSIEIHLLIRGRGERILGGSGGTAVTSSRWFGAT